MKYFRIVLSDGEKPIHIMDDRSAEDLAATLLKDGFIAVQKMGDHVRIGSEVLSMDNSSSVILLHSHVLSVSELS